MSQVQPQIIDSLLERVAARVQAAGVFGNVRQSRGLLECAARESSAPAFYRLSVEDGVLCVSLVTSDRWLSQSIEQDLVHTGDKLPDLLEEELVELGYEGATLEFRHYRSEDMLYTFRSPVPVKPAEFGTPRAAEIASTCLLAYEAMFRELGDMSGGDDE